MPAPAPTLPSDALAAIVKGQHPDPFAVLGPHETADGSALIVRLFRPQVREAHLVAGGSQWPMARLHAEGLFEAVVPDVARDGFDYRYRLTWRDGRVSEIDDTYRYGPVLTDLDAYLFAEGTHYRLFDRLGARPLTHGLRRGVHFAVWAPNARRVSVVGDFDGWDGRVHPMRALVPSGVWEIFIPDLAAGERYKFEVVTADGIPVLKADPFGRFFETPPRTASIVWQGSDRAWGDDVWMASRPGGNSLRRAPMSVYEVHLGSWQRGADGHLLGYRDLADRLVPYVKDMGFTHVELMPIMEHPFTGSWGYQVIGFFAPTSRFGAPEDFQYFVDACHRADIGVILDWVPGHFPKDLHGLARFDGTALYEHADPRQGEHQDWGTLIFNYGRHEVRSFLLSNAMFWLDEFHVDGLRVDAVASMLYLDYSRGGGQWIPNRYGGRENLDAIEFFRELTTLVAREHPGVLMIAEESTAWPGVTRPAHLGGLGFTYKWNMGWMHDMLDYCAQDPIHRKWHHDRITFSLLYAFSEHFILPFSHDEVVHGKRSMLDKMPGDVWQKHATLRALYGYMFTHPGKKLMFMGGEIGQWREWDHDGEVDWALVAEPRHAGLQRWVRDLNRLYADEPALHRVDVEPSGFAWIDCHDHQNSVISFLRFADVGDDCVAVLVNFTPVPRERYRIGVPRAGAWSERLNSDAASYGGSNVGNLGCVVAADVPSHGHPYSLTLTVPPLACVVLVPEKGGAGG
ncbi:MAG: 1,4-alpha-glucan branching protein GlgB [Vicinamibacterales bacterium]